MTLTVTDGWGNVATATRTVNLHEPAGNVAPNAVIGTPNCTGLACTFSGLPSNDPNGDTITYLWNFGDGTPTSTLPTPAHTFAAPGPYIVTLTVTDGWGKFATVTRQVSRRGGKVYLDYVQNGHGRLLVAPFSVRPLPGAPVSMPLEWREVTPRLDIRKFTIRTAPVRMKKLRADPLLPVLDEKPDLMGALENLHARL